MKDKEKESEARWARIEKYNEEAAKWRAESEKSRAESEKSRAESEKSRAEFEKSCAEAEKSRAEFEKSCAEAEKSRAEAEKSRKEFDERLKENWVWLENYKKENKEAFAELRRNVFGISEGNGMSAEEYFYRTMEKTMTFGGNHFDSVDKNVNRHQKSRDGKSCKMEVDILMINDVAVCMIEAKYRARREDVLELAGVKTEKFRKLFPSYAAHKLYLGIGAMSFEDGVEAEAKLLGIGVLRANGDAVEVDDVNLKAY